MEILEQLDLDELKALRDRGEAFWLALSERSDAELDKLRELVPIHPMALADTHEFRQRVKVDDYPDSTLVVAYGAEPSSGRRPRLVEVHLHIFDDALITVPREKSTALDRARRDLAAHPDRRTAGAVDAVGGVLRALAGSFRPTLDGFDEAIDSLQEKVAEHATSAHRAQIFELRRQLAEMRRVVVPQRDLLTPDGNLASVIAGHDGGRSGSARTGTATAHDDGQQAYAWLREAHDDLDRAAGLIDSYREQLESLLDLYLTEVSTRLNEVMKRLTVIATVFLPLTFLSGFFGMNFGWFVDHITPLWTFLVFGIGLMVVSTVAIGMFLRSTSPNRR